MTRPAALPGAALRLMRAAVARRALQVALLTGGLFALGFLCGEQAHATEGAPVTSVRTTGPLAAVVDGVRTDDVRADGLRLGAVGSVAERAVDRVVQAPAALVAGQPMIPAALSAPQTTPPLPPRPEIPVQPAPTAPTHPSSPSPGHPAAPVAPNPTDPAGPPSTDATPTTPSDPVGRPSTGAGSDAPSGRPAPLPPAVPLTLPGAGDQVLGSVVGGLVQGVGGQVLKPVGGLVVAVTDVLGEVTAQIPPLASLPPLSSLPGLPAVPTQPGEPSLPGVPGLPSLPPAPGLPTGPGQTLPSSVPQPGAGAGQSKTGGGATDGSSGAVAVRGTAYGPMPCAGAGAAHASGHGGGQRSDIAGYLPVHQAPGGDPTGELSSRNAVDSGASRHGDACAVALDQRAPLRLLAGAVTRSDVESTRDRHRDVPVSPA